MARKYPLSVRAKKRTKDGHRKLPNAILRDYERGLSMSEVAGLHEISRGTVYRYVRAAGIGRSRLKAARLAYSKRGTTVERLAREQEPLLQRYTKGKLSLDDLTRRTGHDYRTVRQALVLLGIRIRPVGGGRRYRQKTKQRVFAMHQAGHGSRTIARMLNIPRPTVLNWLREWRRHGRRA